jgi:hypothetical protein
MFRWRDGELTVPIHQLYRAERTADEVRLFLGETDWLEEHLRGRPGDLRHLGLKGYLSFSGIVLTDTPDMLQAFFSRHRGEAFDSDPTVYERVRIAPRSAR